MASATYWPFWMGGAGLAAIAVLHLLWTRMPLGLSSGLARLVRFRADERERQAERAIATGDLDAALLAATLARFGPALETAGAPFPAPTAAASADPRGSADLRSSEGAHRAARLPVDCSAIFVACLLLGGLFAHALSNASAAPAAGPDPGAQLGGLASLGLVDALRLLGGGLLVGFGARMAGGCTSGHGLSGLASLRPASAFATAAMFAGGIAMAFWLER